MNEIKFLHSNQKRWAEFERMLETGYNDNPDKISDLYIHISDDLSYSRTYFPNSKTTGYLNNLARKAHSLIYHNQPVKKNRILSFWKYEFPSIIYKSRKEIAISLFIFIISVFIGLVSNKYDPQFVRIILGDSYVNMTLSNIENNDPLAVYKSMNQVNMFLGISLNNIYIAFLAFVFGVLTAIGPGFILFRNGIMLGAFQGFFAQKGLFLESFSTIWIHGTLEIFSIIIAGAAGIKMGNSIVFPGTYTRLYSFRRGVTHGIKMVAGLVPFFIIAAFLEGFITRYTQAPYVLKFSIIGLSALMILCYFFIYPIIVNSKSYNHGTITH